MLKGSQCGRFGPRVQFGQFGEARRHPSKTHVHVGGSVISWCLRGLPMSMGEGQSAVHTTYSGGAHVAVPAVSYSPMESSLLNLGLLQYLSVAVCLLVNSNRIMLCLGKILSLLGSNRVWCSRCRGARYMRREQKVCSERKAYR